MGEEIELGKKYVDKVTGFSGIATAKADYLYDSNQVLLESLIDGRPERHWFDVSRVDRVID